MSADLKSELRRAVLTALKADAQVLALVPKASIYTAIPPKEPAWPWIRWGVPNSTALDAACLAGEDARFTIHVFARGRVNPTGAVIETGEDHVGRIVAAVKGALRRSGFDTPSGHASVRWLSDTCRNDGDAADDWHATSDFRARIMA